MAINKLLRKNGTVNKCCHIIWQYNLQTDQSNQSVSGFINSITKCSYIHRNCHEGKIPNCKDKITMGTDNPCLPKVIGMENSVAKWYDYKVQC